MNPTPPGHDFIPTPLIIPNAFNVLAIMVALPILSAVIASAYCSIRDNKLA